MSEDQAQDLKIAKSEIARLKPLIRITKVVCTRSVKGQRGDSYVGFSAAWDTTQDDSGGGADLISAQGDGDRPSGLTLGDARIATMILGMQVDISAHAQALAGGNINQFQYEEACKAISDNYTKLIANTVRSRSAKGTNND